MDITKVRGRDTGPMNDWSACSIRGKARDIVVISLYLKDGEGISPTNLLRLGQVHGLVQAFKVPWIILGDFNMGPGTLDQGGFLDLIGGTVSLADEGASTCTAGTGSLIDFAIVRKDIADSVLLTQDLTAPWSPHVGIMASVKMEAWRKKIWKWDHPKHLPSGKASGPRNQPIYGDPPPQADIPWTQKPKSEGFQAVSDQEATKPPLLTRQGPVLSAGLTSLSPSKPTPPPLL
jgi:hypothetical protein